MSSVPVYQWQPTTAEIAESFANGMEYFNTYGGNPVSCAVGLAVLDVIEDEGLRENALEVGGRVLAGLEGLVARHPRAGDARGRGLFLGIEFVDGDRMPDAETAERVVQRMRDRGILLSTDGPDHNVIKFKPPMVFSEDDAAAMTEAGIRSGDFLLAAIAASRDSIEASPSRISCASESASTASRRV